MLQDVVTVVLVIVSVGGLLLTLIGGYQTVREKTPTAVRLNELQKRPAAIASVLRVGAAVDMENLTLAEREELVRAPKRAPVMPLLTKLLTRHALFAKLDEDLQKAGSNWRASELVVFSLFLTLLTMILGMLIIKVAWLSVLLGLGTLSVPFMYVRFLVGRWQRRFHGQLPDTLTLMSNALRAGYSFMQAVELVGREARPPICDEFRRISHEISLGVTVDDALEAFGSRINSADVDLLVTAVLIQREVGGALAEILDTIASVIRERLRIQGEIRTLTAQGKITGTMLALMPIGIGVAIHFVTNMVSGGHVPDDEQYMYPLLHQKEGHYLLGFGGTMQLIGFMIIRKIVTIDI